MDRLTRKELKSDKFAQDVGLTWDFITEHKQAVTRYGSIAAVLVIAIAGIHLYRQHTHKAREAVLSNAIALEEANIGQAPNPFAPTFASQEEKDNAVLKAFTDLVTKYPDTVEGAVAEYFLGVISSDKGNLAEAQDHFQKAIDWGNADYASLAKLSLAQIDASLGKQADAQKLIQSIIDHPTTLVSGEQAKIALAKLIAKSNPSEAAKILTPLRTDRGPISRAALDALAQIPQQPQK